MQDFTDMPTLSPAHFYVGHHASICISMTYSFLFCMFVCEFKILLWNMYFVYVFYWGQEIHNKAMYSVTQSLCNSLLENVVLDSLNMVYVDEGSI